MAKQKQNGTAGMNLGQAIVAAQPQVDLASVLAQFQGAMERMDAKINAVIAAEPTIAETRRQERVSKKTLSATKVKDDVRFEAAWGDYKGQHLLTVWKHTGNKQPYPVIGRDAKTWKAIIAAVLAELE